jgi:hypothetical protein
MKAAWQDEYTTRSESLKRLACCNHVTMSAFLFFSFGGGGTFCPGKSFSSLLCSWSMAEAALSFVLNLAKPYLAAP